MWRAKREHDRGRDAAEPMGSFLALHMARMHGSEASVAEASYQLLSACRRHSACIECVPPPEVEPHRPAIEHGGRGRPRDGSCRAGAKLG